MHAEKVSSVIRGGIVLLLISALILCIGASAESTATVMERPTMVDGKQVEWHKTLGLPPEGWVKNTNVAPDVTKKWASGAVDSADVPALEWSYGSGPTSAAMLFGYLDRHRYTNMYAGSTNGGLFPLTNAAWGASSEGYGQCPLSASQQGLDGRATRGHKDDYYFLKDSITDPYVSGGWTRHTDDSLADFMGTSDYTSEANQDGETWWVFNADGSKFYDYTGVWAEGCHGMHLFAESRGYTVTTNFNQYSDNYNGAGFTFDDYKSYIDAGWPVLIHMQKTGATGHTMLGVGYSGTQMIVHDTWDYAPHIMNWGGTYQTYTQYGVSVIQLQSVLTPTTSKIGVWRWLSASKGFYLDYTGNGFYSSAEDRHYTFGAAGDKAVSGDWNGDKITDIGVWRPTTHQWFIDKSGNGAYGAGDAIYTLGAAGDLPVTGDWNNNGKTEIGVWRPTTHEWFLDYSGNGAYSAAEDRHYTLGSNGDKPVTIDLNGDGKTEIGVFRPSTRQWFIDYDGNGVYQSGKDASTTFGANGDIPVTGDWDKNGYGNIGVWRPSTHHWFLDYDGSGSYSAANDREYTLGANGDQPVTGAWSGTSGSASVESVDLTETISPAPAVQLPGVSMPVAAIPRVEMPVKSSTVITPATMGGTPANQNPLTVGGGVKIPGMS